MLTPFHASVCFDYEVAIVRDLQGRIAMHRFL